MSHSDGAHTESLQPPADSSDNDDAADVVDLTNAGPATPAAGFKKTRVLKKAQPSGFLGVLLFFFGQAGKK